MRWSAVVPLKKKFVIATRKNTLSFAHVVIVRSLKSKTVRIRNFNAWKMMVLNVMSKPKNTGPRKKKISMLSTLDA
ncbi:hypothetical protein D3C87_1712490 [compost metagenome]